MSTPADASAAPPGRVPSRWRTVVVAAVTPVAAASLQFFSYPLEHELWLMVLPLILFVWLASIVVAVACVAILVGRRRLVTAAVLVVAVSAGFVGVARSDTLHLGYPVAYFHTHRSEFTTIAAIITTGLGEDEIRLPRALDVGYPYAQVLVGPDGHRAAVVWMDLDSSGVGYGYAYAPHAERGTVLGPELDQVITVVALGDGWWWVSNRCADWPSQPWCADQAALAVLGGRA